MSSHAPNLVKLCAACKNEKDGKHPSYCKSCKNKRNKEYHQNNKEKIKEYYQNNKEKILEQRKEYRENNKEYYKEYKKEYRKNNPHKARETDRKRRALKQKNIHKPYTEDQVLKLYGTNCHICQEEINLSASRSTGAAGWGRALHIDHVIPLSKGGPDSLDNVKPSHGLCNLQKNNKEKV